MTLQELGRALLAAMDDPAFFGPWFRGDSWAAWRVVLKALFALPMSEAERELFTRCTGRTVPPTTVGRLLESWWVCGRRAGKSILAALLAVALATLRDYKAVLAPGERGVVMLLAADRRQARVLLGYIQGFFQRIPMLAEMIEGQTKESLVLRNGITIEVHTASFRAVRGYTVIAAILDEVAFWRTEDSANPDTEIVNAIRPAMSTVPGALLLGISSPYARKGELWRAYKEHFGRDGDPVLVVQGETRFFNQTVDERIIAEAYEQDPAAAEAEYGGIFRRDVEAYVPREAVEALVVEGRASLPPVEGIRYVGFVDPSGGSQDSMTLAVAHQHGSRAVLDLVVERRAPFAPDDVVQEFAWYLAPYGVKRVVGDRYAGEWPRERFRKHGIAYEVAEATKSEIYQAALPLIMSRRAEFIDVPRLVNQLADLERRTSRVGRDTIGPPPGGRDDVANAAAGALVLAARTRRAMFEGYKPIGPKGPDPEAICRPHGRREAECPSCNPGWSWQTLHRGTQVLGLDDVWHR